MTKTKIGLGLAALGRPEYINIKTDNSIDRSEEAFKNNTFSVLNEALNWEFGISIQHHLMVKAKLFYRNGMIQIVMLMWF